MRATLPAFKSSETPKRHPKTHSTLSTFLSKSEKVASRARLWRRRQLMHARRGRAKDSFGVISTRNKTDSVCVCVQHIHTELNPIEFESTLCHSFGELYIYKYADFWNVTLYECRYIMLEAENENRNWVVIIDLF